MDINSIIDEFKANGIFEEELIKISRDDEKNAEHSDIKKYTVPKGVKIIRLENGEFEINYKKAKPNLKKKINKLISNLS